MMQRWARQLDVLSEAMFLMCERALSAADRAERRLVVKARRRLGPYLGVEFPRFDFGDEPEPRGERISDPARNVIDLGTFKGTRH